MSVGAESVTNLTVDPSVANVILLTESGLTVTLPSPAEDNTVIVVKDKSGGDAQTILAGAGQTIDGDPFVMIGAPYGSYTLFFFGTEWSVI